MWSGVHGLTIRAPRQPTRFEVHPSRGVRSCCLTLYNGRGRGFAESEAQEYSVLHCCRDTAMSDAIATSDREVTKVDCCTLQGRAAYAP